MNEIEIKELISGCLSGQRKYQNKLYQKFANKMYGVCLRYARNTTEAEDILQDGFIKVFINIGNYRHQGSFEGWIRRIMVNTALTYYAKSSKIFPVIDTRQVDTIKQEETILDQISANELMTIIQQLPTGFRIVFNMHAIEGFTHKEIGDRLGIEEASSRSQYLRARVALQKLLIQKGGRSSYGTV